MSHVDLELEQVLKAISDLVGARARYSAKYSVSGFIEYNAEQHACHVPLTSMGEKQQTRSDKKHFDKSKGYCGKR
jgi:hypothetical protein